MSGGRYEYACSRVDEFVYEMTQRGDMTPLRRALAMSLTQHAAAMRAVEWEDSGDSGREDTERAIRTALGERATVLTLEALREEHERLGEEIEKLAASVRRTEAPASGAV